MRLQRTRTCGELRASDAGSSVVLNGWVDSVRDHGGLLFLELRDRYGYTQVVVDPERHPLVRELRAEFVVAVGGQVRLRPGDAKNAAKPTGEIEVEALDVELLNRSKTPPFEIVDDSKTREELRLEYRFLDLRRRPALNAIEFRGRMTGLIRRVMQDQQFIEIETPILMKTSPEGARDFLVPSRVQPGTVYGLPQSPQLFKQTLMVSGLDRYFQICKCFRDEDLRADRQPEFTQLDVEMSFVRQEDVFRVIERLMMTLYDELLGQKVSAPFPHLTYHEAMTRYGSDKPDTRFGLELAMVSDELRGSHFRVFQEALAKPHGCIPVLRIPDAEAIPRRLIDEAEGVAKSYGAKGLAWLKLTDGGATGGISKFVTEAELAVLRAKLNARTGDLLLFGADRFEIALTAIGQVRLHFGRALDLIDRSKTHLLWITDFPLFAWNPDEKRWEAMHHMFTAPRQELPAPGEDLSKVTGVLYDLVLNGNEIASGSIRIHRPEIQSRIFEHVGLTREEAEGKFGWFLRVLDYGAPPHGGIALGIDRMVMIMTGASSLRDTIAFPKTASGSCLMTDSPSVPDQRQLDELGILFQRRGPPEP